MCFYSVKKRSREGLEASRQELEEREKVRDELQAARVWLEATRGLLSDMEQSNSSLELPVRLSFIRCDVIPADWAVGQNP